jgi:glycine cleavage system H protein
MEFLETTADKFTFRVPTDRLYSPEGIWFKPEAGENSDRWRVGLTDFIQQHSGDLTFALLRPKGTRLAVGDEIGMIETIKVNMILSSPVVGTIIEVNPDLEITPEVINQDPYGKGWLAVLEIAAHDDLAARLMTPDAYFEHMKGQIAEEVRPR